jgi:hypothetical protein
MSVLQSVRSRMLVATLSAALVAAGSLAAAKVASADSIQVQSYQRASQSEACAAQPGETAWQASWGSESSWTPTWEQWANGGKGGWTCTRSITWAKSPVPVSSGGGGSASASPVPVSSGGGGSASASPPVGQCLGAYCVGDIGPGGGLVFLISTGVTYEMAPNTWRGSSSDDTPTLSWCSSMSDNSGAVGTAVGTGSANTTAMQSPACASGAAVAARAYRGGGLTDWFLPSRDELNEMYTYSLTNGFDSATYGLVGDNYWSSSQSRASYAWGQYLGDGYQDDGYFKSRSLLVRPIRAF